MKKLLFIVVVASFLVPTMIINIQGRVSVSEAQGLGTHRYYRYDLSRLQYGMTTDEVRKVFGKPYHLNRYGGPRGENQQWIYKESRTAEVYLYFENGLFASYQTFGDY